MNLLEQIKNNKIPKHIAIIMDGNGRWAKKQGMARIFGHRNALTAVREAVIGASEIGTEAVTLYAFSTENWNRPKLEVDALMTLLTKSLKKEVPDFQKNGVKVNAIGRLTDLPKKALETLKEVIDVTKTNTKITLTFSLSYGSREEITSCIKKIATKVKEGVLDINAINDNVVHQNLYTHNLPDVDLMIRTSGEQRLSNYLLWQMAYAELYFTDVLWPDFRREDLYKAIYTYQNRERRFGKTSEQLDGEHEQTT
ncbi:undecaprenyl diphosphate synthase [Wenyingzhuangia heitensis]|uniref:Isoprenyl transferase n=1 Tax=Wenyingzhuangia heitensis TaxID=1487859 RepID=A0ABX0U4I9_9FLAO|nr:isoprenyl transferase [Wenyingzhuangia heitensis]NIJ43783.1 undecaprenyl diphosphate synthase [Wenyingzhuangia heitensis]